MKKLLVLACILFLLTGCTEKTSVISCARDEESASARFNITYNDTKKIAISGETIMDLKFSSLTDEQFDSIKNQDFCDSILKNLNTQSDMYSNCRKSINGKIVTLTFDLDLAKLEKFENGLFKPTMSKEEIQKYFERQNAKCN